MSQALVVEDEIHIQRLIKLVLEKNGFTVATADSGEEALAYVKAHPNEHPKLILLDILMPGIDGLQVLGTIKGSHDTKNIPVIMLTALAQENVVLKGIKLGAKDYIRKPFDPKALVERVKKVVNG